MATTHLISGLPCSGKTSYAAGLGVDGWVRNRRDGSVEILAGGSQAAVAALVERCRQGPPAARVERVEIEESDEAVPPGFAQRPTV